LRISEAARLQRADVDFASDKLRVHQQLTREGELAPTKGATRNRRDRRDTQPIDLMPAAREALLELFTDDIAESGFVFRNSRGGPRLARDIARAFQTVVDKAGLPETEDGRVTFHSLRHTALSRLANHLHPQIPLVYVRDFAGHATLATTETYVHKIESAETTAAAVLAMAGTFAARTAGNGED
jgi:integrase